MSTIAASPLPPRDPDDDLAREIAEHIDALREHGYVVGVACHACGSILTARRSVARNVGPVCRGRVTTAGTK